MTDKLQYYYLRFKAKYDNKLNIIWANHINQENILGWSKDYSKSAQYKHIFNVFYSIKSKMTIDYTYHWLEVLSDTTYDIPDITRKLVCNGMTLKDVLEIFEIPSFTNEYFDALTYDGITDIEDEEDTYEVFSFREGANNYTQLYIE